MHGIYVIYSIELMTRRSEYDAVERVHGHRQRSASLFAVACLCCLVAHFLFFSSLHLLKLREGIIFMSVQSPLIAVPRKTTTDVDWATPIRHVIAASYGEDPNNYAEECAVLQRCRQDAVRGAGSDQTGKAISIFPDSLSANDKPARDLLYKYFGQLELLELRFAEIKVSFPWQALYYMKNDGQSLLILQE